MTQKVTNWTYTDKNTLVKVIFGTNYESDPRQVCKLAAEIAATAPRAIKSKPPDCILTEFAETGMKFSLTFWIGDPDGMDNVKSEVMLALWEAVQARGHQGALPRTRNPRSRRGAAGRYHGRGPQLTSVPPPVPAPAGQLALRAPIIKLDPIAFPSRHDPPMSYVEASDTSLRKTGQIKLHGASSFCRHAQGRRAGGEMPRRTDRHRQGRHADLENRRFRARVCLQPWRLSGDADVSRLPLFDLHLDQPCGVPRHARRPRAEGRRYRQYRRHLHRRWLVWRFQPDVCDCADRTKGRAADRGDL